MRPHSNNGVFHSNIAPVTQINTNGILTFSAGYPEFLNQPLPIEYPAIAPFYTNVDTSGADSDVTSISYFESSDARLLRHLNASLYGSFPKDMEFEPVGAFVVTWENVGHYKERNEHLNTFQVCRIMLGIYFRMMYDVLYVFALRVAGDHCEQLRQNVRAVFVSEIWTELDSGRYWTNRTHRRARSSRIHIRRWTVFPVARIGHGQCTFCLCRLHIMMIIMIFNDFFFH